MLAEHRGIEPSCATLKVTAYPLCQCSRRTVTSDKSVLSKSWVQTNCHVLVVCLHIVVADIISTLQKGEVYVANDSPRIDGGQIEGLLKTKNLKA